MQRSTNRCNTVKRDCGVAYSAARRNTQGSTSRCNAVTTHCNASPLGRRRQARGLSCCAPVATHTGHCNTVRHEDRTPCCNIVQQPISAARSMRLQRAYVRCTPALASANGRRSDSAGRRCAGAQPARTHSLHARARARRTHTRARMRARTSRSVKLACTTRRRARQLRAGYGLPATRCVAPRVRMAGQQHRRL